MFCISSWLVASMWMVVSHGWDVGIASSKGDKASKTVSLRWWKYAIDHKEDS